MQFYVTHLLVLFSNLSTLLSSPAVIFVVEIIHHKQKRKKAVSPRENNSNHLSFNYRDIYSQGFCDPINATNKLYTIYIHYENMELEKYNISVDRGFLPATDPLLSLPEIFKVWEEIGARLPGLVRTNQVRSIVEGLPRFPIDELKQEAEWWRAYALLTFISHAYIWCEGDKGVASVLPELVAVPWCAVAQHLDMPPVMTYAAGVIYNWSRCNSGTESLDRNNLASFFSFTGTRDEEWFYIAMLLVETAAVNGICEVPAILRNCDIPNNIELIKNLHNVEQSIKAIQEAVYHMRDECNPTVFYTRIRTFHAGWKNSDVLPDGLLYKGVADCPLQYPGGNAGQSSTLATFDALLGVVHTGQVKEFFTTQQSYMIPQHRLFLQELEARVHLRDYVKASGNDNLVLSFNNTVEALVNLRNEHIKLVCLYVVIQKGKEGGQASLETKGTGGTGFMQLLKTARDNTKLAKL